MRERLGLELGRLERNEADERVGGNDLFHREKNYSSIDINA